MEYIDNSPLVAPGSAEAAELARQIAILRLCAAELERRQQTDPRTPYVWSSRRKVAQYVLADLLSRLGETQESTLTPAEQKQVLQEHPLLRPADAPPPNPAQQYAHEAWFRDLRAKVERFVLIRRE